MITLICFLSASSLKCKLQEGGDLALFITASSAPGRVHLAQREAPLPMLEGGKGTV